MPVEKQGEVGAAGGRTVIPARLPVGTVQLAERRIGIESKQGQEAEQEKLFHKRCVK
jgi:hypothetical protein